MAKRQSMSSVLVPLWRLARWVRKSFFQFDAGNGRSLSDFSQAATRFVFLCRVYYILVLYGIVTFFNFTGAFKGGPPTDPLWPIGLLTRVTGTAWLAHATAISVVGSAFALLAALHPRQLIWRVGVFSYLFLFSALQDSYGSIGHGNHFFLYVSFALLFLPSIRGAKPPAFDADTMPRQNVPLQDVRRQDVQCQEVMACLAVFWLTQAVILFSYSLSGFWKIWHSKLDLLTPDGMIRILLNHALSDTENIPPLLPVVAQYEYLAQLMLLVTVYVQFFSLFALFRPHLHRPFGVMLILFHLGGGWLMNLSFPRNILLVGLFLVLSPMAPARFSLAGLLQSLPVLGIPFRAHARTTLQDQRGRGVHR